MLAILAYMQLWVQPRSSIKRAAQRVKKEYEIPVVDTETPEEFIRLLHIDQCAEVRVKLRRLKQKGAKRSEPRVYIVAEARTDARREIVHTVKPGIPLPLNSSMPQRHAAEAQARAFGRYLRENEIAAFVLNEFGHDIN